MSDRRSSRKAAATQKKQGGVAVSREERQHLIEDVAFFHAEHFRHVEPGKLREEDRAAAKDEIDSVLKRYTE
jgi:hypothetical protein